MPDILTEMTWREVVIAALKGQCLALMEGEQHAKDPKLAGFMIDKFIEAIRELKNQQEQHPARLSV